MPKLAIGAEAPRLFLESLYAFVRDHLAVANGVVLASGTACATLEFLAPGLPALRVAVRLATALFVALIVLFAVAPGLAKGRSRAIVSPIGEDLVQRRSRREVRRRSAISSLRARPAVARRGARPPRLYARRAALPLVGRRQQRHGAGLQSWTPSRAEPTPGSRFGAFSLD